MTVILKDIVPPIIEVSKLGYAAVAVYSLLFQSAFQDRRYEQVNMSTGVIVEEQRHGHTKRWLTRLVWVRRKFLIQLMHY